MFTERKAKAIVWFMIILFVGYFSFFTIMRYRNLYASYFDLGIMHQTVYNTYESLRTGDWSRFLEHTNPHGFEQVKRMAIHNDIILALIAPFYFIWNTPETLLVLQTLITGLGAYAIYLITQFIFMNRVYKRALGIVFVFAYLMYVPLQRAIIFEFHAVTLATSFLLYMFYFWLTGRHKISLVFFVLALMCKEHVALTCAFFGIVALRDQILQKNLIKKKGNISAVIDELMQLDLQRRKAWYPFIVIGVSILWFIASMKGIIPHFRQGEHFALNYYSHISFTNPYKMLPYIFHIDTLRYFLFLFGPLSFFSLFSPAYLCIALPEFAINLLSSSWNMRNIIFHYTAIITPFVFIAAIYGSRRILGANSFVVSKKTAQKNRSTILMLFIVSATMLFAYFKGPLPFSKEADRALFSSRQEERYEVSVWKERLQGEEYAVSTTGHYGPFFTSRRYYYPFSMYYTNAEYVIISVKEAVSGWEKEKTKPAYDLLRTDRLYRLIHKNGDFEVYKKI